MAGRQIHEVPPANIGGSPFCIAVSFRGMDTQKVSPDGFSKVSIAHLKLGLYILLL